MIALRWLRICRACFAHVGAQWHRGGIFIMQGCEFWIIGVPAASHCHPPANNN